MSSNGGIRGAINTPTASAASGRWSVREMFLSVKGGVWPSVTVPFSPPSLNPVLWLDASDTSTITESGGAVSQWNNKGSLGNFTQATGAVQPTTGANTLNGLNVIDFAGDYLTSADAASAYKFMHDGTTYLVCMVAKHNGTTKVYYGNNGTTTGATGVSYYSENPSSNLAILISNSTGSVTTSPAVATMTSVITNDTFTVQTMLCDPDNGTAAERVAAFFDAGSANKTNTRTGTVSSSNPTNVFQIGAGGNNVAPLTGSIAEIIIVSGANATETNRVALRNYLNDKWAVY